MGTSCASRTECAGRSRLATPSMFKGVDAHEAGAGSDQPLRQFPGEIRVPVKVLLRSPVLVPARVHQDRTRSNVAFDQREPIDGALVARWKPRHDAVKVRQRFQGQGGDVITSGIPMKGAVHIGAGVRDTLINRPWPVICASVVDGAGRRSNAEVRRSPAQRQFVGRGSSVGGGHKLAQRLQPCRAGDGLSRGRGIEQLATVVPERRACLPALRQACSRTRSSMCRSPMSRVTIRRP